MSLKCPNLRMDGFANARAITSGPIPEGSPNVMPIHLFDAFVMFFSLVLRQAQYFALSKASFVGRVEVLAQGAVKQVPEYF